MNLTDINSITKYNKFLQHLNSFGLFQKKITCICVLFWSFAGIVHTIFYKEVFFNTSEELPLLTLSIVLGLFGSAYLSYYYNRKVIVIGLGGVCTAGAVLLAVCSAAVATQIAIYVISLAQYSACVMVSCIVFEYVNVKLIPTLAWAFLISYHVSKFGSLMIFSQFNSCEDLKLVMALIILLFGVLEIGGGILLKESLRYLIDNDIQQAQITALQISEENNCTDERVINIIEGSFVWNKVNIKKYGISCFNKYNSLAKQTYYLGISFFCLGIFGKFAQVIFDINERKKSAQFERQVQLMWVSVFQLIGFLPGIIFEKILERKKISKVTSIMALVFSVLLVILVRYIGNPHFLVAIFSLLGLNSFLGSVLFFFIFLQTIEFYPHTIRTLGLSLCLCCYYLGQLVFNLHFYFIEDVKSSFQLLFCCSFLMILHLHNTTETFGKEIRYEIKQIEDREYNED